MNLDDFFHLGHIAKTRGIRGEVSIYLDVDFPQQYKKLESVFVELDKQLVPFFVESIVLKDKGFASVKFEDVSTEPEARRLVKARVFLPLNELPPLSGKQFYFHEVVGFEVIDEVKGAIGTVIQVIEFSQNPLLSIDFDGKEILLPMHDDTIVSLDRAKKQFLVRAPEGLIDLYLDDTSQQEDDDFDF